MDSNHRHPTLGSVMRSLRTRNAWTLKEMSERVDIPVSTLSKVEHDRLTLTYDKLQQLSRRLGLRPPLRPGRLNRFHDIHVARTPAEIAGKLPTNLLFRGIRVVLE